MYTARTTCTRSILRENLVLVLALEDTHTARTTGTCSILRENLVSSSSGRLYTARTIGTRSILRENLVPVLALEDTCIQLVHQVHVVYSGRT